MTWPCHSGSGSHARMYRCPHVHYLQSPLSAPECSSRRNSDRKSSSVLCLSTFESALFFPTVGALSSSFSGARKCGTPETLGRVGRKKGAFSGFFGGSIGLFRSCRRGGSENHAHGPAWEGGSSFLEDALVEGQNDTLSSSLSSAWFKSRMKFCIQTDACARGRPRSVFLESRTDAGFELHILELYSGATTDGY